MSKERLEKLKPIIDFQKENDSFYGRPANITLLYDDIEWLIEQAEQVQELEKENEKLRKLEKYDSLEINNLSQQNQRYREALEKLVNAPQDMSRGRYADYADRIAREALDGEE